MPSAQLFTSNTPYIISEIGNLFCVEKEDEIIFSQNPRDYDLSEENIAALVNQINEPSVSSNLNYLDESRSFFTVFNFLLRI